MQPGTSVSRIGICYPLAWKRFRSLIAGKSLREMSMNPEIEPAVTTCGNCHMPMPVGLRFCRNCGFRLGEGSAEYTETVRFQNAPPGSFTANGAPSSPYSYGPGPIASAARSSTGRHRSRMSGTTWMFIGLLIFFITAGAFTAIVKRIPRSFPPRVVMIAPKSYAGVDDFETTDAGVTFENIDTPDGPADKAGLVGGDIITTVDGQAVHSKSEMTDVMRRTPIGKTVDVVYIRDGEIRTAKLTTISKEELDRLKEIYSGRAEGRGQFGYEDGDAERVEIPNTKMFGVRLGEILPNRPADLAGVKQGDIVVAFDGIPIRTSDEFLSRVRRALPYSTIKLSIIREGAHLEIPVKMGKQ